jgi:hypothetical protein
LNNTSQEKKSINERRRIFIWDHLARFYVVNATN